MRRYVSKQRISGCGRKWREINCIWMKTYLDALRKVKGERKSLHEMESKKTVASR